MIHRVRTIDAHAAGEPLRLIVEGFPAPRGRTMMGKREWVTQEQDHLRRSLIFEPRGHADMFAATLTEPVSSDAHAGIVFMHHEGYPTMSGHGIIALTTTALERGLLLPGGDGASVVFDTPAGVVRARASLRRNGAGAMRVERVAFVNVPAFVAYGGLIVNVGNRQVRVDVAYGGAFYAIVDGEAVGLPTDGAHVPELRRAGTAIEQALERSYSIRHPIDPRLNGVAGTIFTGPSSVPFADLRNVTILRGGQVQRSPSGTGMAAVMAVLSAMGLLSAETPFVYESPIGSVFEGRVVGRTAVGEYDAVIPEITGSAWITGEHTFLIDDDDPFRDGF
jgi:proline racemase